MSADWKPGDVAMVSAANRKTPYRAYYDVDANGNTLWREYGHPNFCLISAMTARPLVVIDPEDAEQVKRLWDVLHGDHFYGTPGILAAALREFASPTPPKPEEPTGLGAVVEDAHGDLWLRVGGGVSPWRAAPADSLNSIRKGWEYVSAVRVLSEGVTS